MPSVLMLSYLFPPRGGAGVQRALKFAKYLPEFGWRALVVANGGTANDQVTTVQDHSLMRDLPAGSVVQYTQLTEEERRRMERMQSGWRKHLAATDRMGWWVEPAVRTGLELLREHPASAILVTMSPFSAAEAGIRLKAMSGLPLVLDLRDPWALDETKIYPTRWHAWRDWKQMERALRAADLVIMNTPEAARMAREAFDLPARVRVIHLTNGFDGEDLRGAGISVDPAPGDVLRIVHTGMFHSELAGVWDDLREGRGVMSRVKHARRLINLWTRTPRYLLEAMGRVRIPKGKLELVLVGELTEADRAMVEASAVRGCVRMLGYRSHDESVAWVRSADALFLPLHTPLDGGPALVVPGKTYEYMGSGRPILAMGPAGDMRRFVEETGCGITVGGEDVNGAMKAIEAFYEVKLKGREVVRGDAEAVRRFERRELTRRLAGELEAVRSAHERSTGSKASEVAGAEERTRMSAPPKRVRK